KSGAKKEQTQKHLSRNFTMSDKDRIPAEVFILFKLEGLKTALSDSPPRSNHIYDSYITAVQ
ncbi:MAG: hypothetical protein SOW08_14260, partial [Lachnospiraceae bacterium]|nr:hypothetical protein [Lachnospiraceae bacterium]